MTATLMLTLPLFSGHVNEGREGEMREIREEGKEIRG